MVLTLSHHDTQETRGRSIDDIVSHLHWTNDEAGERTPLIGKFIMYFLHMCLTALQKTMLHIIGTPCRLNGDGRRRGDPQAIEGGEERTNSPG